MVKCCPLGFEFRVGLEDDGIWGGVINRTDVGARDVRCRGSLKDIGGVACSSDRVMLSILLYPVR